MTISVFLQANSVEVKLPKKMEVNTADICENSVDAMSFGTLDQEPSTSSAAMPLNCELVNPEETSTIQIKDPAQASIFLFKC